MLGKLLCRWGFHKQQLHQALYPDPQAPVVTCYYSIVTCRRPHCVWDKESTHFHYHAQTGHLIPLLPEVREKKEDV